MDFPSAAASPAVGRSSFTLFFFVASGAAFLFCTGAATPTISSAKKVISSFAMSDPCRGIRCPDVSKCVPINGAPTCACPARFKRLISNRCSSQALAHSDFLDLHNAARAAVGAVPMTWDNRLASDAESWGGTLVREHLCNIFHPDTLNSGQNIAKANGSFGDRQAPAYGIGRWLVEAKIYNYSRFDPPAAGCLTGDWHDCGHYTQVVWNASTRVGCASVRCKSQGGFVWVCNYSPTGNQFNQFPYVRDPCFRVACPSGSSCVSTSGYAVCQCPNRKALVRGRCTSDPCAGVRCAGEKVCDGTSGRAVCACPRGKVASSLNPNQCISPSCQGVVCPTLARCKDVAGAPVCSCPKGYFMAKDQCTKVSTNGFGISVALYKAASFKGVPQVFRVGLKPGGCQNIAQGYQANIGSIVIVWDAQDGGATGRASTCGTVTFHPNAGCTGGWSGFANVGGVSRFASPSSWDGHDIVGDAFSVACKI